jgi:hypothetical protein
MTRRICLAATLTILLLYSGCSRFDEAQRVEIASNEKWSIIAIGDLKASGPPFGRNQVRFEAHRFGRHFASGSLYEAGASDHGFLPRFTEIGWQAQDVLRGTYPSTRELPKLTMSVHNEEAAEVRWLRIMTAEIFLVLELPPNGVATLYTLRRGDPILAVSGEISDNRTLRGIVELLADDTQHVRLTIRNGTIVVTEE